MKEATIFCLWQHYKTRAFRKAQDNNNTTQQQQQQNTT